MEKAHEYQQPLFMCFVDFQKAFGWNQQHWSQHAVETRGRGCSAVCQLHSYKKSSKGPIMRIQQASKSRYKPSALSGHWAAAGGLHTVLGMTEEPSVWSTTARNQKLSALRSEEI